MIPWALIAVLSIVCTARPRVHQPNKVINVALGDTVTLRCSAQVNTDIFWYKQTVGQQPRVISVFQKFGIPIFYNEFKNDRFQGNRLGSNCNLIISNTIQSDEAVYYCGSKALYIEFGSGTQLLIKASTILKSGHLNDSIEFLQKCYGNITKQVKTDEKLHPAVYGLAVALGLCGVLVFALMCLIFKRGMCEQWLMRDSRQDNRIRGQSSAQDSDDENLTYAALRFRQKTMKPAETVVRYLMDGNVDQN
ncbi:novel immune-type receptor 14b isoform X2 [Myxocyprinus asiaticus]|uniref:novel immune-type receptor 14b isoform X2 n=1 Tax=Myxocyprinus asiaticus TaxID=70543 RepID=UPI0022234FDC|nr:novel immune-type receptor 14b isoform X2 [Myxocyprinus asiaticus]